MSGSQSLEHERVRPSGIVEAWNTMVMMPSAPVASNRPPRMGILTTLSVVPDQQHQTADTELTQESTRRWLAACWGWIGIICAVGPVTSSTAARRALPGLEVPHLSRQPVQHPAQACITQISACRRGASVARVIRCRVIARVASALRVGRGRPRRVWRGVAVASPLDRRLEGAEVFPQGLKVP